MSKAETTFLNATSNMDLSVNFGSSPAYDEALKAERNDPDKLENNPQPFDAKDGIQSALQKNTNSSWSDNLVGHGDAGIPDIIANTDLRRDDVILSRDASEVESNHGTSTNGDENNLSNAYRLPNRGSNLVNNPDFKNELTGHESVLSQDLSAEATEAEHEASSAIRNAVTDAEQAASNDMTAAEGDLI